MVTNGQDEISYFTSAINSKQLNSLIVIQNGYKTPEMSVFQRVRAIFGNFHLLFFCDFLFSLLSITAPIQQ